MTHRAPGATWPLVLAALLAALLAACGGSQPAPSQPEANPELPPDRFSSRRVLGELEMLLAFRADGASEESREAARRRVRGALEEARIAVDTVRTRDGEDAAAPREYEHLVATLPGDASDRIVLVAPLDAPDSDTQEAAQALSGAALLVELARVFAHRDFPYTLQFVWIDEESGLGIEDLQTHWRGGRSLARSWAEEGRLDDIRLLVAVNRVCGTPLEIARDLGSHRNHRDQIFRTARALGRGSAFPTDRPFASVLSSHVAFRKAGVRTVVAIEGFEREAPAAGEGEAEVEPQVCNPTSVDTAGLVLVEGLERIGERLAKIDRFARVPQLEEPAPEPEEPDLPVGPASEPTVAPGGADADAAP